MTRHQQNRTRTEQNRAEMAMEAENRSWREAPRRFSLAQRHFSDCHQFTDKSIIKRRPYTKISIGRVPVTLPPPTKHLTRAPGSSMLSDNSRNAAQLHYSITHSRLLTHPFEKQRGQLQPHRPPCAQLPVRVGARSPAESTAPALVHSPNHAPD